MALLIPESEWGNVDMEKTDINDRNIPKEKFCFVNSPADLQAENSRKSIEFKKNVKLRRFFRNRSALMGAVMLLGLVLFAVLVPLLCSNSYTEIQALRRRSQVPS